MPAQVSIAGADLNSRSTADELLEILNEFDGGKTVPSGCMTEQLQRDTINLVVLLVGQKLESWRILWGENTSTQVGHDLELDLLEINERCWTGWLEHNLLRY